MGYDVVEFHGEPQEHYNKVVHLIQTRIPTHFVNPTVTKVWVDKSEYHTWKYQIHLKTHDGHNHEHHYTVLYEVKGQHAGHVELIDIHEGLQSFVHVSK